MNVTERNIRMVLSLCPEQQRQVEKVISKVVFKQPLTDEERAKNPEVWARAEKFFDFKTIGLIGSF